MNRWKWLPFILVAGLLALLVASALLTQQLAAYFPFLENLKSETERSQGGPFHSQPDALLSSLGALFTLSVGGILILYAIPARIHHLAGAFSGKAAKLLRLGLLGLLAELLVLAVAVTSALTLATFPLTILLVMALFAVGYVGFVALAFAIGRGLLRRAGWQQVSPIYPFLLGLLTLLALARLPFLGFVLFVGFSSLGLGATIATRFGSGETWTLTPLMED